MQDLWNFILKTNGFNCCTSSFNHAVNLAFKVETATEVLQRFTLLCNEADDLQEALSKVNHIQKEP